MAYPPPETYLALLYALQSDDEPRVRHTLSQLDENDKRLAALLDALAEICVCEDGQGVAVSIALAKGQTTLYVAQDDGVPPKVVQHLTKVWNLLTQIKNSLVPAAAASARSNRTAETKALEYELILTLYEFSCERLRHLFTSRTTDIFFRHFVPTVIDAKEHHEQLVILVKSLRPLSILISKRSRLTREELQAVVVLISSLARAWRPHLADESPTSLLSRWDAQSCLSTQFSLRRFLEQLFLLETHNYPIRHIALSRRFAPFLEGLFTVVPVPLARRDISIDTSPTALAALLPADAAPLARALTDRLITRLTLDGRRPTDTRSPALRFPATRVHAPCALLAFHHRGTAPAPLGYIGVAGALCAGCAAYFGAYNTAAGGLRMGVRDQVGGCAAAACFPWAAPVLGHSVVDGAVWARMAEGELGREVRGKLERVRGRVGADWAVGVVRQRAFVSRIEGDLGIPG